MSPNRSVTPLIPAGTVLHIPAGTVSLIAVCVCCVSARSPPCQQETQDMHDALGWLAFVKTLTTLLPAVFGQESRQVPEVPTVRVPPNAPSRRLDCDNAANSSHALAEGCYTA